MKGLLSADFLLLQGGYFIFSLGGLALKSAARQPFPSLPFFLLYAAGLGFMFLFAVIWQRVLKSFPLLTAYAWRCAGFLWNFLWAVLVFGETITAANVLGASVIVAGILLVASDG